MTAFVGRTAELRTLRDAIKARARPGAALVIGVAGSGKSRLLREALEVTPGVSVLAAVGYESESGVPLAGAAGLLRSLAAVKPHGEAIDALALGRARGSLRSATLGGAAFEPLRIFEASHRALSAVKEAVVVIDDLQWLDEMSFALCHYLVRAAVELQQRVTILAATRPDGAGEALFDSVPQSALGRIELGPLSADDAATLARAVSPGVDLETAQSWWRTTEGNPFWLEALARYATPGEPGDRLDRFLTQRLRGAGAQATTLLGMLAVAGRPVSPVVAAEVLGWEADAVDGALRALVDRGLVEVDHARARPVHDFVRMSAVAQLPEELRVRLHGALAGHFERTAGTDLQLLRAALHHRRAAGLPVLPLAASLASMPRRRLLGLDGLRELGLAADEADPLDPDGLALHAAVARLAHELADYEEALARWSVVADRADDGLVRASAALEASRAAYALGRADEARELLDRSRALASDDPALAVEQTTHEASICLWLEQRTLEGRDLARLASSMARRLSVAKRQGGVDHAALARAAAEALKVEYEAALQIGDPAALLAVAEQRERAARSVGQDEALDASLALGAALRQNGRVREALARFRRAWADAHRAVLPRVSVDAGFWLGRTLMLTAELEEAEAIVDETRQVARRIGDVARARHRIAQLDAGIEIERGRVLHGLAVLDQEISRLAIEHPRIVLHADRALWTARLQGPDGAESAVSQVDAGEHCVRAAACPRCTGEFLLVAAEALSRIGHRDAARDALSRRDALGFALEDLDRLIHRHASALSLDDPEARASALDAALAAAAASPYRLATLWIRLDLGRGLAALHDERAVVELKRAATEAQQRGAATVRALALASLRGLGVRAWRRGAPGAPLTAREEEVARLVSGGATNREVASALFLSPKTVERHLVNLYRKLEVRNRTELAARFGESEPKRTGIPG